MKQFILHTLVLLLPTQLLWAAPEVLTQYLPVDEFIKGSEGMVVPPREIQKYASIVEKSALKDPKWFNEFSKNATPGVPLPYDERLGLTKKEYAQYIETWNQREFHEMSPVALRLEKSADGTWMIRASGTGFPISTLRFDESGKELTSPNGKFTRLDDIQGTSDSLLGAWQGQEWVHESETTIAATRENFAIGKKADGKKGYLIYRLQEVSKSGRKLFDKQIIIQFPIRTKQ